MEKVSATTKAIEVIQQLKEKYGNVLFQQSYGCCDGTAPMLYEAEGFYLSSQNILLGEVEGIPYYIDKSQKDYYTYSRILIDVLEGNGATFSLESTLGYGFLAQTLPMEQK